MCDEICYKRFHHITGDGVRSECWVESRLEESWCSSVICCDLSRRTHRVYSMSSDAKHWPWRTPPSLLCLLPSRQSWSCVAFVMHRTCHLEMIRITALEIVSFAIFKNSLCHNLRSAIF